MRCRSFPSREVNPLYLSRLRPPLRCSPACQPTAESALVLLGAAAIALLLVAWATGSGKIGELFDAVVGQLISKAG